MGWGEEHDCEIAYPSLLRLLFAGAKLVSFLSLKGREVPTERFLIDAPSLPLRERRETYERSELVAAERGKESRDASNKKERPGGRPEKVREVK